MPDLNDVVRHVILRIIVDQAGLAEELTAAREKLKGLRDAERDTNRERAKQFDVVTKAVSAQNDVLERNRQAHEAAQRAAGGQATKAAEGHKANTDAIKGETQAIKGQLIEEARAEAIRRKSSQDELDRIAVRSRAERRARTQARQEEEQQRRRRPANQTTAIGAAGNVLADVAVLAGRSATTARRAASRATPADPRDVDEVFRRTNTTLGRAEEAFKKFADRVGRIPWVDRFFGSADRRFDRLGDNADKAFGRMQSTATKASNNMTFSLRHAEEAVGKFFRRFDGGSGVLNKVFGDSEKVIGRWLNNLKTSADKVDEPVIRARSSFRNFFDSIPRGARDASQHLSNLSARVRAFIKDLDRPGVGGGDSLFRDILTNFDAMGQKLASGVQKFGRHLFSMRTAVVAVIAVLGPLAAILGAVGAAALAVGSDIVALAGSLLALPGILGAAVAGFGALAIAVKPLSDVFSAYSAAQKEATQNTNAAKEATNAYERALISQQRAQLAYQRAQADVPRSQQKLNDARKQAARDIEDYRLALQKLRHDEEGAALGVESAELEYRKALADPTKTGLDRRIARHDVEGALFDQRDQKVAGGRLLQDSSEAFKKGVEGADAVVDAMRGVEDATLEVRDAQLAWKEAILATDKANKEALAGGTAAAKYQAELDKLSPSAKKVVLAIIGLKDEWKKLQSQLSEAIFGPLADDTGKFADVLNNLKSFLLPAAGAFGALAKSALELFTNPAWTKFFDEQGRESGDLFLAMGNAVLAFADGLRVVTELARPFTRFVVEGIGQLADRFKEFAESESGRKEIAWFLDVVMKRMKELAPVVGNLVTGLWGFFKALNQGGEEDFTTWFNTGLLKATETFVELSKKAQDPNGGFQKWLRGVKPLLHDIVTFLGDAARFFGRLFSDTENIDEARKILKEIGAFGETLANIFQKLSESELISKLASAIGDILKGFEHLFDSGIIGAFIGGLTTAFEGATWLFEKLTGFINWLTTAIPGLDGLFKALGFTIAVILGAALVAQLSGAIRLIKGIMSLIKGVGRVVGAVADPEQRGDQGDGSGRRGLRGRFKDRFKDTVLGRDSGVSAKRGQDTPGAPGVDRSGTGGVLPHLTRIERLLIQIRECVCRLGRGTAGGGDRDTRAIGSRPYGAVEPYRGDPNWQQSGRPRPTRPDLDYPQRALPGPSGQRALPAPPRRGTVIEGEVIDPRRGPGSLSTPRRGTVIEGEVIESRSAPGPSPTPRRGTVTDDEIVEPGPSSPRRQRTTRAKRRPGRQQRTPGPIPFPEAWPDDVPFPDADSWLPTVDGDDDKSRRRKSRTGGFLGGLKKAGSALFAPFISGDDRGSFRFGGDDDDDRPSRRRPGGSSRPGGRGRVRGRSRVRRGVPAALGSGAGRDDDADYEFGYEDGLSDAGGGDDGGGSPLDVLSDLDFDLDDDDDGRRRREGQAGDEDDRRPSRRERRQARREARRTRTTDPDADRSRRGGRRRAGRGGGGRGGRLSRLTGGVRNLFRAGGGRAGGGLSRLTGGLRNLFRGGGGLARVGGGLARGLVGGIGGAAAALALSLGGDAAINKFVKDDEDAASLSRGLGAVSTGAGIGATIGSVVPGVGTAIGGVVGGAVGGAYSLFKDKNLRDFVGGKISGAAKSAGGFVKGVGSKVGGFVSGLFGDDKDEGKSRGGGVMGALAGFALGGPIGALLGGKTDIGKNILDSLKKAGKGIGDFFTKDIPHWFGRGIKAITDFFTKTLPSLPGKAFDAITTGIGALIGFFKYDIPRAAEAAWNGITRFFTKTLPEAASAAWGTITTFFTETLPNAAAAAWHGITRFFTETLPNAASAVWSTITTFFTETLPNAAQTAWNGITNFFTVTLPNAFTTVVANISTFFSETLPNFFTKTLPDAIGKLPGFVMNNLIKPVVDFFAGIGEHIGDAISGGWDAIKGWAASLWSRAGANIEKGEESRKMSGGLIEGVYQGIQDTAKVWATPGEFMVRKSKVDQPGAKAFLRDFNDDRITMADLYGGLAAATAPQVMSIVPPDAGRLTGAVPTVVNNTVNHAPLMGDVTIHNPVREKSEYSLRRQVQIAAIRHRR